MRIDSHHHLWRYTLDDYGWIDQSMGRLQRDFLPADLSVAAAHAEVDGTVAVQARQTLEETRWLLDLAKESPILRGVVGWAPIAAEDFPDVLSELRHPQLKGLRHVVQGEPVGFLDQRAFNRGIAALRETGLVYDLLIFERQLEEAIRFVDRHPEQSFVLDHIGKPDIRGGGYAAWDAAIRRLALRGNVVCKLSGMVTEADWRDWSAASLRPYFDTVLEAFGPARLMAGTDWPVLTVACEYGQWWKTIAGWIAPLSGEERASIEGGTATRVYGLG